jgi:hypothetical protein
MPSAETVFCVFNLAEGVLWIGIGLGFAVALWRSRAESGLKTAARLLFVAFGISDFVEIHTGGWYKPWWLFAWKAACVCGLLVVLVLRHRRQRAAGE